MARSIWCWPSGGSDDARGRLVYREPLVWLARDPDRYHERRATAADRLSAAERDAGDFAGGAGAAPDPWRIVCTCGSLSGLTAAALRRHGRTRAAARHGRRRGW